MISALVKRYEEYQEKKLFKISMAAMVVEENLQKALKTDDPAEKEKIIKNALDDARYIGNKLTKNDFGEENAGS